ncbi:shikimate kinase [Devosia psychrophila]|uniref:Shikimate kinase n=1 Tax=Devosia psychrophila TaxID=728005 RepID=A0A0F5Q0A7_9HYPH|nr:shikimate kinase [Devosia psychrophila]KKC34300.1 shikimate kinase [Devosia psychrophila]SFD25577.1 shikimate kinase [Devosia psychrophila]
MNRPDAALRQARAEQLVERLGGRPLVLVGMMGAGKTTVGRRLAARLNRNFLDSDEEIEKAAQMTIPEIFEQRGEPEFRAGETRVIARVLKEYGVVLATGGGAFVNLETRALMKGEAVTVWLKAEIDILFERVSRRSNRPLLKTANPRATLQKLIDDRYPIYAEADVTVISRDVPQDAVAGDVVEAVLSYLKRQDRSDG